MITILRKPWMDREDGRIIVVKHNKVIFSKHYRNMDDYNNIVRNINKIIIDKAFSN